jgi:demethylmenaquinone methyltransferase/2-methoxy-6-polyprenyl-1,4-benzoquinol methylase
MATPALEPTTESRLALVERFFSGTAGSYDFIVHATTLGADRRWKRRIVASIPPHAERILDLASGTGILTFAIAARFPRAHIVGVELREEYLRVARRVAHQQSIDNVEFVLGRAEDYVSDRPFDAIVSSYLAKYADLTALTHNARVMLGPGGRLLMHDFTYPSTAFAEKLWRLQFGVIRPVFGTLFPAWRNAFDGLPALIEQTRWVPDLVAALRQDGFGDIRVEELSAHGATMVSAQA